MKNPKQLCSYLNYTFQMASGLVANFSSIISVICGSSTMWVEDCYTKLLIIINVSSFALPSPIRSLKSKPRNALKSIRQSMKLETLTLHPYEL
jgi:hypothetical protein